MILAVSVKPIGVERIVPHLIPPQSDSDSCSTHHGPWMASLILNSSGTRSVSLRHDVIEEIQTADAMSAYLLTQIGGEASNGIEYDLFFLWLDRGRSASQVTNQEKRRSKLESLTSTILPVVLASGIHPFP